MDNKDFINRLLADAYLTMEEFVSNSNYRIFDDNEIYWPNDNDDFESTVWVIKATPTCDVYITDRDIFLPKDSNVSIMFKQKEQHSIESFNDYFDCTVEIIGKQNEA